MSRYNYGYCGSCQKSCHTPKCGCGGVRSQNMKFICPITAHTNPEDHWNTFGLLLDKDTNTPTLWWSDSKPDTCNCGSTCGCDVRAHGRFVDGNMNGWLPVGLGFKAQRIEFIEVENNKGELKKEIRIVYNDNCEERNVDSVGFEDFLQACLDEAVKGLQISVTRLELKVAELQLCKSDHASRIAALEAFHDDSGGGMMGDG